MNAIKNRASRRMLLEDIDWQTYSRLLRVFAGRRSIRLTYRRGRLEIRSTHWKHKCANYFLGRFAITLTEEFGLPICTGGSTTYRRRKKMCGLEPDNSYWIANESKVRTNDRINLKVDPPPDLAIDVDVASSSLDRMAIYASLKVPEVWRYDDGTLAFLILSTEGKYAEEGSLSFPGLKSSDLLPFLAKTYVMEENALVREFRAWLRQRITEGWK
jgi:Uma2 family endonuclease